MREKLCEGEKKKEHNVVSRLFAHNAAKNRRRADDDGTKRN